MSAYEITRDYLRANGRVTIKNTELKSALGIGERTLVYALRRLKDEGNIAYEWSSYRERTIVWTGE